MSDLPPPDAANPYAHQRLVAGCAFISADSCDRYGWAVYVHAVHPSTDVHLATVATEAEALNLVFEYNRQAVTSTSDR